MFTVGKPFQCYECCESFSSRSELQTHYQVHKDDDSYEEEEEENQIDNKTVAVIQTMPISAVPQKPYQCSVCKKSFAQKGSLKNHYKVHTGDRPFKCNICGRGFSQKGNLNTHYRTHTGERPYRCTLCDKCFTQNVNLKMHYRTHGINLNNPSFGTTSQ